MRKLAARYPQMHTQTMRRLVTLLGASVRAPSVVFPSTVRVGPFGAAAAAGRGGGAGRGFAGAAGFSPSATEQSSPEDSRDCP
jgi:hypothetical protein